MATAAVRVRLPAQLRVLARVEGEVLVRPTALSPSALYWTPWKAVTRC